MTEGKNRIMIFGPKSDGTYIVEFRTAAGDALAISVPRGETAVINSRSGCPMGCFCLTCRFETETGGTGRIQKRDRRCLAGCREDPSPCVAYADHSGRPE